ncbi:hypothetical protein [Mycobacterium deserti]|uniref:DUF1214 domain-containing protein n=1 Tax=Mycobacterium deserti TaxID=2978347 RepID=A0ABT2M9U9_9MYCO|nr:hypothetical protein [Mycobacterium deserti]MCT7659024.1 hypothetical protein [Mycobacterium deserti]
MATAPDNYGRFIGRVGALAVALGIGVAIANTPAIAAADEGADSSSSSESSSSESTSASTGTTSGSESSTTPGSASSDPTNSAATSKPATTVGATRADDDEKDADEEPQKRITADENTDSDSSKDDDDKADDAFFESGSDGTKTVTVEPALSAPTTAVASSPATPDVPAPAAALFTMVGSARREAESVVSAQETVSPLATPQQLEAERIATATVNTLPVAIMKFVLRAGFLSAANQLFPGGPDAANVAELDRAVNEYAMAAAFQQQLLNPLTPRVVTQVAPPHNWFAQYVGGSRILYDNPDTIYRFMAVSGSSEYVIRGRFHDLTEDGMPADTSFSVLEGLAGTTSSILTVDENFVMDADGNFEITVSTEPANGRPNHLQITPGSTIIAARNTLGDWNEEVPTSLSIERVGGPPNSLFAQLGGFAFLGSVVSNNPLLTTLVSLVPPLPYMPPLLRGTFTALILIVRGVSEQAEYMALATRDPDTGAAREPNVLPQPSSNAEFLANQLQSNGFYELADDEALVLTIDPGRANYFIVPTYNDWTITDDYWNLPTSLNDEQARPNPDGTYTVVISKTDPLARNWVSTGGLNQGTISIRFQDLGPDVNDAPRILGQRVVKLEDLDDFVAPDYFVTTGERTAQLELRRAGFNKRWAPYPQA